MELGGEMRPNLLQVLELSRLEFAVSAQVLTIEDLEGCGWILPSVFMGFLAAGALGFFAVEALECCKYVARIVAARALKLARLVLMELERLKPETM
ncbi:hypothetical protein Pyn_32329 [Prunus yedoensis var. nudiflora]|uniref:Uncharacterized protein n=1 Tax=Prunus yedoensis var. nudiflora TaxID=2094558 RepID=A0A314YPN4_PRUYE|nr:hypothetical protein Pyn_32329 [Prunus yedoensis var. nudiflora]